MSLTASIDTPERSNQYVSYPVAASTKIYAGSLVALNSSGFAVPASDTAGLIVKGRSEQEVDNSAGIAGAVTVIVKSGAFKYANSGTHAVSVVGSQAVVEDDGTVASTSTNLVGAGKVIAIDSDGVWVAVGLNGAVAVVLGSTNGTAAAAADLAALKTEAEHIGDDVRAIYAALVTQGILK